LCTENPAKEGSYSCDCEESILDDAVAGLSCEHVATAYCTFNQEVSSVSFCTNHGTCVAEVSPESAHLGCNCPENYDGDHCQFVKGTNAPNDWPTGQDAPAYSERGGDKNVMEGVTAVIILICLGFVGVLAYFVYTKRKIPPGGGVSSPELELDADGEVLKEAMSNTNGSGKLHSAEFELEADGSVLKEAVALPPDSGSLKEAVALPPNGANFDDSHVSSPKNGTEDSVKDIV
jgi:hypothetical protein